MRAWRTALVRHARPVAQLRDSRAARRASGAGLLQVATALGSVGFLSVSSHLLDLPSRGQLATFVVTTTFLGTSSSLGFPHALLFYRARGAGLAPLVRATYAPLLLGMFLAMASSLAALKLVGLWSLGWILVTILSIPVIQAVQCVQYLVLAGGRFGPVAVVRVVTVVFGIAILAGTDAGTSALSSASVYVVTWAGSGVLLLVMLRGEEAAACREDVAVERRAVRRYALQSLPLALASYVMSRADVWLVALVSTEVQTALYSGSVGLSEVAAFVPTAVGSSLFVSGARRESATRELHVPVLTFSAILTGIGVLVAPTAVRLLLGPDYSGSVAPLRVALIAAFLTGTQRLLASEAAGVGDPKVGAVSSLVGAGVLLVTVPALAHQGGALGASLGYLFAGFAALVGALVQRPVRWSG